MSHPPCILAVMQSNLVAFGNVARFLGQESRRRGLRMPAFRSPPKSPGVVRSIRRWPDGGVVVMVRVRGRPLEAVVGDMVEGVLVANGVDDPERAVLRGELRAAVVEALGPDRATDAA